MTKPVGAPSEVGSAGREKHMVYVDTSPNAFKAACDAMREERRAVSAAAVDEAHYSIRDAANVFGLVSRMLSMGWVEGNDAVVISLTTLCERALRLQADRDDLPLENLVRYLKEQPDALKHQYEEVAS